MKVKQQGGRLSMKTFLVAAMILGLLAVLYFFMKRREGFESPVIVRYYFLPGCGWCERFNPEWEAFVAQLAEDQKIKPALKNIKTEKINGKEQEVPVQGFPTVHIVDASGKVEEYKGNRTATDLMKKVLEVAKIN